MRAWQIRVINALDKFSLRVHRLHAVSGIIAVVLTIVVLSSMSIILKVNAQVTQANEAFQHCQQAAAELQESSDYLTTQARMFVKDQRRLNLENYFNEIHYRDRRGNALQTLRAYAKSDKAVAALETARQRSDELAQTELYALRLESEALHLSDLPQDLVDVSMTPQDTRLSDDKKHELAYELLNDNEYTRQKLGIRDAVQNCSSLLSTSLDADVQRTNEQLNHLNIIMNVGVVALLLVVLLIIATTNCLLLWPMSQHIASIREDKRLETHGAVELRTLTDAYNDMYDKNHDKTESLSYEAHYDALTGVLNRGSFEDLLVKHRHDSALLLVDVDLFKQFNDEYGHDMGDAILIEVAATLYSSFRSTDFVCRIGGDEFAVIMTNVQVDLRDVIAHKVEKVAAFLRDTSNGLPAATISVGVAFGEKGNTEDTLFNAADKALYEVKRRGRDGYAFAHELNQAG